MDFKKYKNERVGGLVLCRMVDGIPQLMAQIFDVDLVKTIIRGMGSSGRGWTIAHLDQTGKQNSGSYNASDWWEGVMAEYQVGDHVAFWLAKGTEYEAIVRGKITDVYVGGYRVDSFDGYMGWNMPLEEEDILFQLDPSTGVMLTDETKRGNMVAQEATDD